LDFEGDAEAGRSQMKREYLVVFEKGKESFGAQAPDIPGCFAVGKTLDETRERYLEAAESHLRWMANDHEPLPQPVTTKVEFLRIPGEAPSSYYVEWLAISVPVEQRHAVSA
jgi:predicted RNase H-like HicB family nuclease